MQLLPGPKTTVAERGTDCFYLDEFNEDDVNPNPEGGRGGHDDDEEDGHDPRYQRAECATG